MDAEIEKLAIYRNGEVISTDDVLALVSSAKETSVFRARGCTDGAPRRRCLSAMQHLLEDGATGQYLLSMVARQVRMIAIAQDLAARQVPRQSGPSDSARPPISSCARRRSRRGSSRRTQCAPFTACCSNPTIAQLKTGTTDDLAMTEMITRAAAPAPPRWKGLIPSPLSLGEGRDKGEAPAIVPRRPRRSRAGGNPASLPPAQAQSGSRTALTSRHPKRILSPTTTAKGSRPVGHPAFRLISGLDRVKFN